MRPLADDDAERLLSTLIALGWFFTAVFAFAVGLTVGECFFR